MDDPSKEGDGSIEKTPPAEGETAADSGMVNFLHSDYSPYSSRFAVGQPFAPRSLRTSIQLPGGTSFARTSLDTTFSTADGAVTADDGTPIEIVREDTSATRRTERLKTGDTWRREPDMETLEMKNKDRLVIYKGLGWIMEDKESNPIVRELVPGLHNTENSSLHVMKRGDAQIATAHEMFGITTLQFENGDKIVFDNQGIASISRRKDSAYIREPVRKSTLQFRSPGTFRV